MADACSVARRPSRENQTISITNVHSTHTTSLTRDVHSTLTHVYSTPCRGLIFRFALQICSALPENYFLGEGSEIFSKRKNRTPAALHASDSHPLPRRVHPYSHTPAPFSHPCSRDSIRMSASLLGPVPAGCRPFSESETSAYLGPKRDCRSDHFGLRMY